MRSHVQPIAKKSAQSASINFHEKLIKLLLVHVLSYNISESLNELFKFKSSSTISISNIKSFSELHDVLKVDSFTRILFSKSYY